MYGHPLSCLRLDRCGRWHGEKQVSTVTANHATPDILLDVVDSAVIVLLAVDIFVPHSAFGCVEPKNKKAHFVPRKKCALWPILQLLGRAWIW
jgi:hypothetical protein